ncbi:MAG TPA: PQQ-dependent sugar dehydrogenase, partial [Dehalococcoidia bacterium]|nr:PQQ-dependent sugar dehydrogenase [Dehalococcoidia bacterium]
MLGIAIDPEFFANRYVYVYYMEPLTVATARPVVVRFTEQDGRGIDPQVILGDLPPTQPPYFNHVAGHIHFGPDGYLYVSIGDYGGTPESAQDLSTVRGKLLRVQRDGSPAPGNPFNGRAGADARVFAYGLRNSFDFTFEPGTGRIYASENGPDRCDELNFIVPGHNY